MELLSKKAQRVLLYRPIRSFAPSSSLPEHMHFGMDRWRAKSWRPQAVPSTALLAHVLGYARQSREQIAALVRASYDLNDSVRNNATRALGVLAESSPKVADRIPAEGFVAVLSSGSWTDRNKAAFLLSELSKRRSPRLLHQLRSQALNSLIEMARWRSRGHADFARILLGRIAGIEEVRLQQLVDAGQVEQIIHSLQRQNEECYRRKRRLTKPGRTKRNEQDSVSAQAIL